MNKNHETSILILCGGRGSRLGKKTLALPKPLIPVNGRPMLSYILERFLTQDFLNISLGVGHLANKIEEFLIQHKLADLVKISNAGESAGMLKRISHARNSLTSSESTIVAYGDTFIDISYQDLVNTHQRSGALLTMITGIIKNPFGVVQFDEQKRVSSFLEKPTYHCYIGSFIFSHQMYSLLTDELVDLPDGEGLVKLFQILIARGQLATFQHNGLQVTFNTDPELMNAEKTFSDYYTLREHP